MTKGPGPQQVIFLALKDANAAKERGEASPLEISFSAGLVLMSSDSWGALRGLGIVCWAHAREWTAGSEGSQQPGLFSGLKDPI